jgi:hypothetical protein
VFSLEAQKNSGPCGAAGEALVVPQKNFSENSVLGSSQVGPGVSSPCILLFENLSSPFQCNGAGHIGHFKAMPAYEPYIISYWATADLVRPLLAPHQKIPAIPELAVQLDIPRFGNDSGDRGEPGSRSAGLRPRRSGFLPIPKQKRARDPADRDGETGPNQGQEELLPEVQKLALAAFGP